MSVEGIQGNHALLMYINEMMGKDVVITSVDGRKYTGIFVACSQEMDFGFKLAYEITEKNKQNILPLRSEVEEKMMFKMKDIVNIAAVISEEKPGTRSMGFATDRDYHDKANGHAEEEGFEEWNGEEDEGVGGSIEDHETRESHDLPDQRNRNTRNGWTVEEMFAANKARGVVSTFDDDLTQYTNAAVEGTDEDRARAERLAREIEQNATSKFYSKLENDDDERDLDKETREEDFEAAALNNRRGGGQQRGGQRGGRGGPNTSQVTNKRAEGLKNDRRNSGGAPSSSRQSSSQQQQAQQQQQTGGYAAVAAKNAFPGGAGKGKNDEFPPQKEGDWQMSKGKTFESGAAFKNQQKVHLEQRPNRSGPTPSDDVRATQSGTQHRIEELQRWKNDFSYKSGKTESKETTPSESPSPAATPSSAPAANAPPAAAAPQPGNAWNRGPPSSLVSNKNHSPSPAASSASSNAATASSSVVATPTTSAEVAPVTQHNNDVAKESSPAGSTSGLEAKASTSNDVDDKKNEQKDVDTTNASEVSSTSGKKKFEFNVNAPEFKPRTSQSIPSQPQTPQQYGVPPHQMQPQHQQAHVVQQMQGQPIVGGMPMVQGMHPQPGMNQQVMVMPWPNQGQYQNYQLMPGPQQMMVQQGVPMTRAGQYVNTAPPNRRQPTPAAVYMPQQWQPQAGQIMHAGQTQVSYMQPYQQYNAQGGPMPPPGQYQVGAPGQGAPHQQPGQMAPPTSGAPGGPPQQQQPQVFAPQSARGYAQPPVGYVIPQQGRYQGPPPQIPHDPHHYSQGGPGQLNQQGNAQSGPNSQPPTPGPQPVASPAQGAPAAIPTNCSQTSLNNAANNGANQQTRSMSPAAQPFQPQQQQQQPQNAPQQLQYSAGSQAGYPPPPPHTQYAVHPQHAYNPVAVAAHQQQQQQQQQPHPQQHVPQQYYTQPLYQVYPQGMIYGANAMQPMGGANHQGGGPAQGQPGGGPQQHGVMDGQMEGNMHGGGQQYGVQEQYGNWQPGYYAQSHPPPHAQAMSRQNSLPQQQYASAPPPGMTQTQLGPQQGQSQQGAQQQ